MISTSVQLLEHKTWKQMLKTLALMLLGCKRKAASRSLAAAARVATRQQLLSTASMYAHGLLPSLCCLSTNTHGSFELMQQTWQLESLHAFKCIALQLVVTGACLIMHVRNLPNLPSYFPNLLCYFPSVCTVVVPVYCLDSSPSHLSSVCLRVQVTAQLSGWRTNTCLLLREPATASVDYTPALAKYIHTHPSFPSPFHPPPSTYKFSVLSAFAPPACVDKLQVATNFTSCQVKVSCTLPVRLL